MHTDSSGRSQRCDVVVIGAGIAGLAAATTLGSAPDVVVLESARRPGGRVETVRQGDYWVNVGTQFAEGSGVLFDLMDRFAIERGSLENKRAALAVGGRMVAMDNPVTMVLRSRLPIRARVDLARFGLRIRRAYRRLVKNPNRQDARDFRARLDGLPGSELAKGVRAKEIRRLISDLSGQWIGCEPHETAATQLLASIGTALEKAADVPNFSLPIGGNQTLIEALADGLGERLRLGATVRSVTRTPDGVTVEYVDEHGPATLEAAHAIVAIPADRALDIVTDLPESHRSALAAVEYGRYVLAGIFTKESGEQRFDDYFGIVTPELSFQEVFNHAAALRGDGPRKPGGALVCLAGGDRADKYATASDAEIERDFVRDLITLLPELDGQIDHVEVRRHPRVVPFWRPGNRSSVRQLREPLGPVHFAGDYILGVPSLADAAASGVRAATAIQKLLA